MESFYTFTKFTIKEVYINVFGKLYNQATNLDI